MSRLQLAQHALAQLNERELEVALDIERRRRLKQALEQAAAEAAAEPLREAA